VLLCLGGLIVVVFSDGGEWRQIRKISIVEHSDPCAGKRRRLAGSLGIVYARVRRFSDLGRDRRGG
jgi:hypothetical protein